MTESLVEPRCVYKDMDFLSSYISCMKFNGDGTRVAVGCEEGEMKIFDFLQQSSLTTGPDNFKHAIRGLASFDDYGDVWIGLFDSLSSSLSLSSNLALL